MGYQNKLRYILNEFDIRYYKMFFVVLVGSRSVFNGKQGWWRFRHAEETEREERGEQGFTQVSLNFEPIDIDRSYEQPFELTMLLC